MPLLFQPNACSGAPLQSSTQDVPHRPALQTDKHQGCSAQETSPMSSTVTWYHLLRKHSPKCKKNPAGVFSWSTLSPAFQLNRSLHRTVQVYLCAEWISHSATTPLLTVLSAEPRRPCKRRHMRRWFWRMTPDLWCVMVLEGYKHEAPTSQLFFLSWRLRIDQNNFAWKIVFHGCSLLLYINLTKYLKILKHEFRIIWTLKTEGFFLVLWLFLHFFYVNSTSVKNNRCKVGRCFSMQEESILL